MQKQKQKIYIVMYNNRPSSEGYTTVDQAISFIEDRGGERVGLGWQWNDFGNTYTIHEISVTEPKCCCAECGKEPHQIQEYVTQAKAEGYSSPKAFVVSQEGTYNAAIKKFWCTKCYIKLGCPLGTVQK